MHVLSLLADRSNGDGMPASLPATSYQQCMWVVELLVPSQARTRTRSKEGAVGIRVGFGALGASNMGCESVSTGPDDLLLAAASPDGPAAMWLRMAIMPVAMCPMRLEEPRNNLRNSIKIVFFRSRTRRL